MSEGKRIFGAIVFGAALFFFWPAVVGGFTRVSALRTAVADRQALLDKRTAILASIDSAYQEYQQNVTGDTAQKFEALVPVHKDQAEIISALQAIGGSSGVQVSQITMAKVQTSKGSYQTMSINFDLKGSYNGLKQFLSLAEQYVRLLNVNSIDAKTDPTTKQVTFTVSAETYSLK